MKIITRGEAMRIHQQHPASRLFPFCTGKYRWHGSAEAYTGTRSQLINSIDILRARRATGLMTRDNYRTVNNITLGKYQEAKR
ncbi:DUF987 domain-containing protein [Escherichia coli]|nr:DUF987 domain-containing protein [Escherichia coli]